MNFDFYLPTRLLTGEGCVRNNPDRFRELGECCLIVTGASSAKKSGALADVTGVLEGCGVRHRIYDGIGQNPRLENCLEAGALAREMGADFLVGIGGGSPLDAAKAAAVYAANPMADPMDIFRLDWPKPALPLILVGTTAGTGSEVGPVAVLTTPAGKKQSINRPDCFPRTAFGDPRYNASLPLDFTVSTALDALSHALEGFFSVGANDMSDLYALRAASMLLPELKTLGGISDASQITPETRERIYYASVLAGFTLGRCGTCYPHTLGYFLTEEHGVAHGAACAAFLEDFLRRQARLLPGKAARLQEETATGLEELCALIRELNAPLLPEVKADHGFLRDLAQASVGSRAFQRTAPSGYTAAEAEALLRNLFG